MQQMAFVPMLMKRNGSASFYKMLGTGAGYGYSSKPDFGTYALLSVWENRDKALQFESSSTIMKRFRRRTREVYSIFMQPVQSRGMWSGQKPFQPVKPPDNNTIIAVLTRATLRTKFYKPFWQRVGGVSKSLQGSPGLIFTKGIGERPWTDQATFSVWNSFRDMQSFAYGKGGPHLEAIRKAKQKRGFREELFAWFEPFKTSGSWDGFDPLKLNGEAKE
jgi:hypothetical protein